MEGAPSSCCSNKDCNLEEFEEVEQFERMV